MPEWEKLTQPQSAAFVSMPSLIDPALAPEGCHVIHAYLPATEPYEVWEGVARGTPAYDALKKERVAPLGKEERARLKQAIRQPRREELLA